MAKNKKTHEPKKKQDLSAIKRKNFFKKNKPLLIFGAIFIVIIAFALLRGQAPPALTAMDVDPDKDVVMHYFHSRTCGYCIQQNKFMETLEKEYPELKIIKYEVSNPENIQIYKEMAQRIGGADPERLATPTTFVGNRSNVGFGGPDSSGLILIEMIEEELERINNLNN